MDYQLPQLKDLLEAFVTNEGYIVAAVIIAIFNVFFWSACWSCSVLETRGYSPLKGFCLGMIFPVVHPCYSYFMLKPISVLKADEEEKRAAKENEDIFAGESVFMDSDLDIGPGYFKKIYRDQDGKSVGPFTIELESNIIVAETIEEVHEQFIVIIIKDEEKTQRLRIPYTEIQNCIKE